MAKLSSKYDLLVSPFFIVGLILLFLNDHLLKYAFPCWITGKLSDFLGLFLFGLFWLVIFPKRLKLILVLIGFGFVFWKTQLSTGLIIWINDLLPFSVNRTIDYSDLIALLSLIVVPSVYKRYNYRFDRLKLVHLIPAIFVFSATSVVHPMIEEQDKLVKLTVEDFDYKISISKSDYMIFLDNVMTYQDTYSSLSYFDKVNLQNDTLYLDYRFNVHHLLDSINTDYFFADAVFYEYGRNDNKVKLKLIKAEASVRHDNIKKDLKSLMSGLKHQIKNVIREYKN